MFKVGRQKRGRGMRDHWRVMLEKISVANSWQNFPPVQRKNSAADEKIQACSNFSLL
jgi:hypothetical protein